MNLATPRQWTGLRAAVLAVLAAGVPGDRGGMGRLFGHGALGIVEAGWTGPGKLAIGAWAYSRRQDDIGPRTSAGAPARSRARGAYLLAETRVAPHATGFARFGLSDGDTTPYAGGWQAGLLVAPALAARPDSQLSFGVNQAFLARKYRARAAEAGHTLLPAETGFELTYADRIAPFLTLQPDILIIRGSAHDRSGPDAIVVSLRIAFAA